MGLIYLSVEKFVKKKEKITTTGNVLFHLENLQVDFPKRSSVSKISEEI